MNLTQKIFAGIGVATLASAAAYPHVDSYLKSLPQKMDVEQAGKRYLEVVCPANIIADQARSVDKKINQEMAKRYYVGSDELARANMRVGALNNNMISLATRLKNAEVKLSQDLMNPKYIWPDNVQKDVEAVADENFRHAGWLEAKLKGNDPGEFKGSNASDTVRRKLNLPVRGSGCPSSSAK